MAREIRVIQWRFPGSAFSPGGGSPVLAEAFAARLPAGGAGSAQELKNAKATLFLAGPFVLRAAPISAVR